MSWAKSRWWMIEFRRPQSAIRLLADPERPHAGWLARESLPGKRAARRRGGRFRTEHEQSFIQAHPDPALAIRVHKPSKHPFAALWPTHGVVEHSAIG